MTSQKKRKAAPRGRSRAKGRRPTPKQSKWRIWVGLTVAVAGLGLITWAGIFLTKPDVPFFDGGRAFSDIQALIDLGPRVPQSPSHQKGLAFLRGRLDSLSDQLTTQSVFVALPAGDTLRGTNLIASFNLRPKRNVRVMLGAHWDSRAHADRDPDAAKTMDPVPGANDGASGVAVLLEMARLMHDQSPDVGVDLLLFDLEDVGAGSTIPFAAGSEQFALENAHYRPTFGIIVDMVCDRNLRLPREANSVQAARSIVDLVWDAADDVDAEAFLDEIGGGVTDDHVAFLKRGIPVIDIIQSPFPDYWHTTADTPDKCSTGSLEQVGSVLARVVYTR